jgi:hypothetical protein
MKIHYYTYSTNPGPPIIGFSMDAVHPIISKIDWCCENAKKELSVELIGNAFHFHVHISNRRGTFGIFSENPEGLKEEVSYSFTTMCPFCRQPVKAVQDKEKDECLVRYRRPKEGMW